MHNTAPRKPMILALAKAGIKHTVTVHGLRRTFNKPAAAGGDRRRGPLHDRARGRRDDGPLLLGERHGEARRSLALGEPAARRCKVGDRVGDWLSGAI